MYNNILKQPMQMTAWLSKSLHRPTARIFKQSSSWYTFVEVQGLVKSIQHSFTVIYLHANNCVTFPPSFLSRALFWFATFEFPKLPLKVPVVQIRQEISFLANYFPQLSWKFHYFLPLLPGAPFIVYFSWAHCPVTISSYQMRSAHTSFLVGVHSSLD